MSQESHQLPVTKQGHENITECQMTRWVGEKQAGAGPADWQGSAAKEPASLREPQQFDFLKVLSDHGKHCSHLYCAPGSNYLDKEGAASFEPRKVRP